jgi:DNA-3-methyladenine glycosylase
MKFFKKPTLEVAKGLLGKVLVRQSGGRELKAVITEVEAYDGPLDLASHASRGLTPRTKVMFGPPGTWYVYFTYGMHWMLNIVTREKGYPAAILIRSTDLASGPGRLTKRLKIDKKLNGKPAKRASGLWIEDSGIHISQSKIKKSPRIGVDYAGPIWSKKHWRFYIS